MWETWLKFVGAEIMRDRLSAVLLQFNTKIITLIKMYFYTFNTYIIYILLENLVSITLINFTFSFTNVVLICGVPSEIVPPRFHCRVVAIIPRTHLAVQSCQTKGEQIKQLNYVLPTLTGKICR